MSNFAIEGLISGFDTTSLIDAILDIQVRGPIKDIQTRIDGETEKFNAFQSVNASLLSLDIASQTLGSPTLFDQKQTTSSNDSIAVASANSSADVGYYSLRVDKLATAQQISTGVFSSASDELNLSGKFIVNGKTVSIDTTDTMNTVATKINSSNAGVSAAVFQVAPNQNKLVLTSTRTGVDKLELREVGNDGFLSNIGLIDNSTERYDYTVQANNEGAISNLFAPTDTFGNVGDTFSIRDGGGHNTIDVTLTGARTLSEIADDINAEATSQGAGISAKVVNDSGQDRLVIESDSGIPTRFSDPNNVLFSMGVVSGVQGEELSSSVKNVGELLSLGSTTSSTIEITDGDSSDSINVDIDLDSDTLTEIAQKINDAAGLVPGSDISAQVITVNGYSRLELSSGSGRAQITSDPDNVFKTLGIVDNEFLTVDQEGHNSQFAFNGVTINRNSNLIDDLAEGVSFALQKESSETVSIHIKDDTSNVESAFDSYVKAYNDLTSILSDLTYYNPQTQEKGTLFGDSTIRQLEGSLAGMISRPVANLPNVDLSELNDGNGVGFGKIQISGRDGSSATIDLTGAQTVQDVLDEINSDQTIKVKASVSTSGKGITLVDTSGATGAFSVEEVDGGTTAADLGLEGSVFSDTLYGSFIYEGGASSLGEIGLSLNSAGSLDFNSSDLSAALSEDPQKVRNLLQANTIGFIPQFKKALTLFTATNTGLMDATTQAITDRIDGFNNQIKRYEDRASTYETTLRRRFTSLEVSLSQSQQLSDYLTQHLNSGG